MKSHILANFFIGTLSLWAVYTIVSSLLGINIYFPFIVAEDQTIPFHRLQTVRLAILATFAFYGAMHFFKGSEEVYPIHFLKIYIVMLCLISPVLIIKAKAEWTEFIVVFFFFWVAATLHFATGRKVRRYFSKK